jgi:two-component system, OmpR family, sensor histidine kinase KdpD
MHPPLSQRRRVAGFALAALGLPLLTAATGEISLFLAAVVGVALVGGLWPALVAAVGGFLLLNYFHVAPLHSLAIARGDNLLALAAFVVVAVAVSAVVDLAARRAAQAGTLAEVAGGVLRGGPDPLAGLLRQLRDTFGLDAVTLLERVPGGWHPAASDGAPAATSPADGDSFGVDDSLTLVLSGRPLARSDRRIVGAFAAQAAVALRQQRLTVAAEGDKVRTALLAAVGHDLRTPLASAKAAVAGLRSTEVSFDAEDEAELLATADESLDRLAGLVANLLDMSRLQAGALGVTLTDVGLEDVVPAALDELGVPARSVTVRLPDDLPAVRADPGLLDRVIVNVVGNALRFSTGTPPEITGVPRDGFVELHVVDQGPGIAPDRWDLLFQPFQRLGDRDNHTGVGLGLALSRGLAEAMGGGLTPAETPGGGLTMILSLPAAGRPQ